MKNSLLKWADIRDKLTIEKLEMIIKECPELKTS